MTRSEESKRQGQESISSKAAQGTPENKDREEDDANQTTETLSNGSSSNEQNNNTSTNSSFAEEGEILQLLNSAEEDTLPIPLTDSVFAILKREPSLNFSPPESVSFQHEASSSSPLTQELWYGHILTEDDALEAISKQTMFPDAGRVGEVHSASTSTGTPKGITWYVTVIPDAFFSDGKLRKGLNQKDFDPVEGSIKPRRASLPITVSQLFSSITKVPIQQRDSTGLHRYIFHGLMNGWPGLRVMELLSLEQRRNHTSVIPKPKEVLSGQILWWKTWEAPVERSNETKASSAENPLHVFRPDRVYRALLRCPPWTSAGWSPDSPGFCFWYEPQRNNRLSYGTNILQMMESDPSICTHVHMIAHRYAVKGRESPRDRLTYHTVCLLEWDHREYCTVLELAFLNGLGGYKGQTNWYHDRDEPITGLYKAFPPEMIMPWKTNKGEIRCFDLPHVKSLADFKEYLEKYRNTRFIDPQVAFSHAARLTFRSKRAIAQYLLNYCQRDSSYAELKRNCQTFAADMSCFLAGKKGVQPFHPVSRIDYQNRTYLFLYDAHLYNK